MAYLRQLSSHFDPVYIKPTNLSRTVSLWRTSTNSLSDNGAQQYPPRRDQDRRCGIERRSRKAATLLDTRSPHARRKLNSRRQVDDSHCFEDSAAGIDVYA
jgi:hypothetical protein